MLYDVERIPVILVPDNFCGGCGNDAEDGANGEYDRQKWKLDVLTLG